MPCRHLKRPRRDRCIVTLYGILGGHPPTDPSGFAAFASTLQFPDIKEILHQAEPLDGPVRFRYPTSVRHHYERLTRFPSGLLVMGDALCTFNPIYGQGMSVAVLQALALRAHLGQRAIPEPRGFFREAGRPIDVAWSMAARGDLAFPQVPGHRSMQMRLFNAYAARLFTGAARDPWLGRAFLRVAGLVDPPQALMAPRVAARVLVPGLHASPRHLRELDRGAVPPAAGRPTPGPPTRPRRPRG